MPHTSTKDVRWVYCFTLIVIIFSQFFKIPHTFTPVSFCLYFLTFHKYMRAHKHTHKQTHTHTKPKDTRQLHMTRHLRPTLATSIPRHSRHLDLHYTEDKGSH